MAIGQTRPGHFERNGRKRLAAITMGLATLAGAAGAQERPQVAAPSGPVIGTVDGPANVFKGVPFAVPPVGALRWTPPAPTTWKTPRDASAFAPPCPQAMLNGRPSGASALKTPSEDCLYLNVWAPKAAKKAPVMVWIYGGAYRMGAGSIGGYDGVPFTRDGVVLVTFNYRLGALGYFAHPALTKAAKADAPLGNYGLMDQMAALAWVKKNISAFGGDPNNVTVFGESAGAGSVIALMATPSAKGLFNKAIVESGGGWQAPTTLAAQEARGADMATHAGLPGASATLDQLRALPPEKLLDLPLNLGGAGPFPDGRLLKEEPESAFAAGRVPDIPLIIGSNSFEASLMRTFGTPPESVLAKLSPAQRALYPADNLTAAHDVFTDQVMGAPARWVARQTYAGAPTFLYYFSYVATAIRPTAPGANHASDILYAFGNFSKTPNASAEDKATETLLHGCWVGFARTGRPVCPGGQDWPAYNPADDKLLEIGVTPGVRQHLLKARLDAVDKATGHAGTGPAAP